MIRTGGRAWMTPIASGLLLVAAGALTLATPVPTADLVPEVLPNVVLGLLLPLLGATVLTRLPDHRLGRLWVATGLAGSLTLAVRAYALLATDVRPGELPLGTPAAWLSSWLWVLGASPLLTFGLLLFPDGRLPSRRWSPLLVAAAGSVVLPIVGQALAPGKLDGLPVDNPLGVDALETACAIARSLGSLCFVIGVAGGAAALVARWRRGGPDERYQLALPALAAGLLGGTFLVPTVDQLRPYLDAVLVIEVTLLLISFSVAVLRDRVAGSEVVLQRSLTYGLLTSFLSVGYVGGVAALSQVLPDLGADLLATVGIALLTLPLRDRLRRTVRRAVYGDRHDPLAALGRLGDQLDAAAEPSAVLAGVAEAVASSLRLPHVQVVIVQDGVDVVAGRSGRATSTDLMRLPLTSRGEVVGALLVAPRAGQDTLSSRDFAVLDVLRRQAAPAVAAVRLAADLRASRQRIVTTREEERRRLRRDLHDGLGPTLAGISLGLEIARSASDPQDVDRLLAELREEAAAAVHDVRRLVEDLRPPAIDELGLIGALCQHADRVTRRNSCTVKVTAPPLEGLPAAVEVAAYRIAMEAINNAVRHAAPSLCQLTLCVDGELVVEITDDGIGIAAEPCPGVGLAAMRERATELGGTLSVARHSDGGTRVLARLPLPER